MDAETLINAIRDVPLMAEFDSDLRSKIAKLISDIGETRTLDQGHVLFERGDDTSTTGIVLIEGTVNVDKGDGSDITVPAPDLLGEMHQFDDTGQRTATVTTRSRALIHEFRWHDFVYTATRRLSAEEQVRIKEALHHVAGTRLAEWADQSA